MNSKHKKTLRAVFASPARTIDWSDIERLLVALGCTVLEGSGSRVKFAKDGIIASFHRPHPDKEAKKYQVKDARDYLTALGISGDEE